MKIFREVGIAILIAIAIFVFLQFNIQSYTVRYGSMLPNIKEGDWIMVSKASYFISDPQRGDVVVFSPPFDSPHPYIKRVIGLPGDIIEVKDNKVFVNGIPLEEEYTMAEPDYEMQVIEVPADEYFVLGDNRNNSNDSRYGWTVARGNIVGEAWFTYWPAGRWTVIKHYGYPELSMAGEPETAVSHPTEARLD